MPAGPPLSDDIMVVLALIALAAMSALSVTVAVFLGHTGQAFINDMQGLRALWGW